MSLKEWNDACRYAVSVCESLSNKERTVKLDVYITGGTKKGMRLIVYDALGYFYDEFRINSLASLMSIKSGVDYHANTIKTVNHYNG